MKIADFYRERGETAQRPNAKNDLGSSFLRRVVTLSFKISALSLSAMLLIGVARAQTSHGQIVNLQPTQAQLESTKDQNVVEWNRWNGRVQPDVDRLYDEIMRATTRP
jgi:hypothetical protein